MAATASSAGCGHLVPSFIALNMLKKSDELCKTVPLGGNLACGSADYMNELDRRALCTLYCCCSESGGRQSCVASVLYQADGFHGFKGHYKPEVSYRDGAPVMTGKTTRPWYPTGKFPNYPAGSRRPDVVVVKDGSKPPTLDNIQKVYEMKFPPDRYDDNRLGKDGKTQKEAYKDLFGKDIDDRPMDAKSCGCDDKEKQRENVSVLEKAAAWAAKREEALAMKPLLNDEMWPAAASALGGGVGSVMTNAAAWFARAAQVLKFGF